VYVAPIGSKHESESLFQNLATNIVEVETLRGIVLLEGILMCILELYQTPLTIAAFVNYYRRLSSLRLSNQALWLNDKTVTLTLAVGVASSSTYVVTLGCSSSMAEHMVMNQGSLPAWQIGGITLSIILLAHM
jgi:hypothetical protein